ncbi:NADH-ubiquinone oxidoreductase chain G [Sulfurospirillum diekertiae]|uniref:NADH-ubiquinone oxidoreductase chain G n=1 Tax=Sulfurospirillum diekertiae TaxID=1854492 RepID=A0A290HA68_9BACT|nr:NADH-quinone oxidoreductase subunit G [Sulfurospirillum diekertiae]ATB68305.1 NADH-ubiquinone oxidoreductase chain G [Sulfurospirillum diekertiae]
MSDVLITIDGKQCTAQEGEYVLGVARRNDIFIPALCYVTNCSPTLACRLCLVDIDGKRAYSCNARAKEGMNVITKTEEIEKERRAIMEIYDINHPLECGVCDQSGECELQNYTLHMGVDSQHHCIADTHRPTKQWGKIHYDASLCIVCERCVTVCKDMIGESALKTVPRGGAELDKAWKDKTEKDAYAMWNKLQKSIIGIASGAETLDCTQCGECTAVCPVGALVGSDFQYTSNAWELKKIPASNPHSSDCSLLYYDVKHTSISNPSPKIYRVNSDHNYAPLHAAARYGFDFQNEVTCKDENTFTKAVELLQTKVDTIVFDSYMTNEEALILQKLKEKFGFKLINEDAKAYQNFLKHFASTAGTSLYGGDLKSIAESNFVVSFGTAIKTDSPNAGYAMNNAIGMNKGAGIYFHPVADPIVAGYSKNLLSITHKIGAEEAIAYLLLDLFGDKEAMPKSVVEYLATFHTIETKTIQESVKEEIKEMVKDEESGEEKEVVKTITKMVDKEIEVDTNALVEMIGAEADLVEKITKLLDKKDSFSLIAGEDLYNHPRAENIAKLLGLIERFTAFKLVIIPSRTNTLGVSLICDLDEQKGNFTLGYNVKGDFTLSALGKGDLDMPALNQQEGTFTSMNKRVVPTNAALPFKGYCLNDIANALGLETEWTIDYTPYLPLDKGFKAEKFDALPNRFENDGTENRGYVLTAQTFTCKDDVAPIESFTCKEGDVVYRANPVHQFSAFTNKAHQLNEAGALYVSTAFLEAKNLHDGAIVTLENDEGIKLPIAIKEEKMIDGLIAYLPTFDTKIDTAPFFKEGYRFAHVAIKGVEHA